MSSTSEPELGQDLVYFFCTSAGGGSAPSASAPALSFGAKPAGEAAAASDAAKAATPTLPANGLFSLLAPPALAPPSLSFAFGAPSSTQVSPLSVGLERRCPPHATCSIAVMEQHDVDIDVEGQTARVTGKLVMCRSMTTTRRQLCLLASRPAQLLPAALRRRRLRLLAPQHSTSAPLQLAAAFHLAPRQLQQV